MFIFAFAANHSLFLGCRDAQARASTLPEPKKRERERYLPSLIPYLARALYVNVMHNNGAGANSALSTMATDNIWRSDTNTHIHTEMYSDVPSCTPILYFTGACRAFGCTVEHA